MIKDFCKTKKFKKVILVFVVDILKLPHTVISNSEKLTHPTVRYNLLSLHLELSLASLVSGASFLS